MAHIEEKIAQHYTTDDLLERIDAALAASGVTSLTIDALKPVDEFHTGGLEATDALLSQLEITPETRVLDIGAGLGGTARHILHRYGAMVTGVDLTPAFVEVADALNARLKLGAGIRMLHGSALDLPVPAGGVDLAVMFHVGMNIEDKHRLLAEVARVLTPGGTFALFDVMRGAQSRDLAFPLPWSERAETSFVADPQVYEAAAAAAGLTLHARHDRSDFTLAYFEKVFAFVEANGTPPLGIHLLMRETAGLKLQNYVANVQSGRAAPTEMIFRKPL